MIATQAEVNDDEEELVDEEEIIVPANGKRSIMPIETFWPVKRDDS